MFVGRGRMADTTFYIVHEEPIGQLPAHWAAHWKLVLTLEAGAVYEALIDEHLASTEVSLLRLTRFLSMSKARFGRAVALLETHNFLWLDAEERPPIISVRGVPDVDPDAPLPEPRKRPKTPWDVVWQFVNHWCELHERYVVEAYPRPEQGSRDTYLIDEMLRTYSVDTLKAVASYFFKEYREGRHDLAYFKFHLPRLVSEYKDQGGVTLPKMREES